MADNNTTKELFTIVCKYYNYDLMNFIFREKIMKNSTDISEMDRIIYKLIYNLFRIIHRDDM